MIPTFMISDPFDMIRAEEFPQVAGTGYLNAASVGPLPARTLTAVNSHLDTRAAVHRMTEEDFVRPMRLARDRAARLIGADAKEIALTSSTSFGINVVALGLRVPRGSTVLVSDREFPANVYPWMNRDRFRLERIPTGPRGWPDEARLLERIARGDVSILAISSVQFVDGFRADLTTLGRECRSRGVHLVVDAIQSLGQLPLDVREVDIDVLATGGHKWLCAPFGTGFLYVRREVQERLEPTMIGLSSMLASQDFERVADCPWGFFPDARRYEVATPPLHDQSGLAASLDLLIEAGPSAIAGFLEDLLEPLIAWATNRADVEVASSLETGRRSGILGIRPPNLGRVAQALKRGGVVASVREETIRFSAHLYNTPADIGRAIEILDGCARKAWR
jgi:cysteine desulfurase / selenocysteine lyase